MDQLGKKLLEAASNFQSEEVERLLEQGAPVNVIDPRSGATPLICAAAFGDRATVRVLSKHPETDYLVEDRWQRTASITAMTSGHDMALSRMLHIKELQQERHNNGEGNSLSQPFDPDIDPSP